MADLDPVIDILDAHGPLLTSELAQILSNSESISNDAARKKLERSRKKYAIKTTDDIRFQRNQRFVYLDKQFKTPKYRANLNKALFEAQSTFRFPLIGLEARGGIVPEWLMPVYSGLPYSTIDESKLVASRALDVLIDHELIFKKEHELIGNYYCTGDQDEENIDDIVRIVRSRLNTERILLEQLFSWTKRIGLISPNQAVLRNKNHLPECGFHNWDFSGPSYAFPLKKQEKTETKPGSIVADVILSREVNEQEIEYFLRKTRILHNNPRQGNAMTILVANYFQYHARMHGRSKGVLMVTPAELFGHDFEDLLLKLESRLDHFDQLVDDAPEMLPGLMQTTKNLGDEEGGLRGFAFELFCAWLGKEQFDGTPELHLDLPLGDGKLSDIDVFLRSGQSIHFFECKGTKPTKEVPLEDVTYWFKTQVPAMRKLANKDQKYSKIADRTYHFWTSGSFSSDAEAYLQNESQNLKKIKISWRTGKDLLSLSRRINKSVSDSFKSGFEII